MIVTTVGMRQGLDATSFTGITAAGVVRMEQLENSDHWEVEFDGDLTVREQWWVKIRAASQTDAAEQMLLSLLDAYPDLRQIRNSTGNLSAANLSNAVRALANAQIRTARLIIGDIVDVAE